VNACAREYGDRRDPCRVSNRFARQLRVSRVSHRDAALVRARGDDAIAGPGDRQSQHVETGADVADAAGRERRGTVGNRAAVERLAARVFRRRSISSHRAWQVSTRAVCCPLDDCGITFFVSDS